MTIFAYRLETKRVKDPDFPYMGKNLTNPEAVAEFCRSLQDSDVEKMIVLHLTTKNRLIGIQVFSGTVDRAVIHPRELVKQSLLTSAAAIILVHNCVFRRFRTLIPEQSGHLFRRIAAGCSGRSWTPHRGGATLAMLGFSHKSYSKSSRGFFLMVAPFRLIRWAL